MERRTLSTLIVNDDDLECRKGKEKKEIYQRQNYLLDKVVVTDPMQLIDEMPKAVGPQFQGEWALYSCSMLSASLVNTTILYKENQESANSLAEEESRS